MARDCPHCGTRAVMGIGRHNRRLVLICPRCNDRFYPMDQYV